MNQPLYVVDVIGEVVASVTTKVLATIQANETAAIGSTLIETINYQACTIDELIETLIQYDRDPAHFRKKYPIVFLKRDFLVLHGKTPNVAGETTLNIYIIHQTNKDYKAMERDANVFKPVLYPIYYELLKQLALNTRIMVQDVDLIEHGQWDRVYWGRKAVGGNDQNKLTDYIDAIELENMKLKFYNKC